jgi:hypothetical protein
MHPNTPCCRFLGVQVHAFEYYARLPIFPWNPHLAECPAQGFLTTDTKTANAFFTKAAECFEKAIKEVGDR